MTTHITYCRNCAAMCGLHVIEEGGRIIDIRGDRDRPTSAGYFCVKGMATRDFHNGDDRLWTSLRRIVDGGFAPIDAETAMDEVYAKLSDIIARYGPDLMALYYGTVANCNALSVPAAKAWAKAMGVDYISFRMTLDQSAKWVTAGRMGMFATGEHQAPDIDVMMVIGSNPAASHAFYGFPDSNSLKQARAAQKSGMKLIVVDPRRSEVAKGADLNLPVRPGEDVALFAGLIRMVLDQDLRDAEFCPRFTTSIDRLRAAVDDFMPEYVAERCGLSVELLQQAVELFTSARRVSALSGTGPNMALDFNLAEHFIEALNAIYGGYRRAGDIKGNTGYYGDFAAKEAVYPRNRSWEQGKSLRTVDIGPIDGEYPTALLPSGIKGNAQGEIRALIQVRGNLLMAWPDPEKQIPLLEGLDLTVCVDVRETATYERRRHGPVGNRQRGTARLTSRTGGAVIGQVRKDTTLKRGSSRCARARATRPSAARRVQMPSPVGL